MMPWPFLIEGIIVASDSAVEAYNPANEEINNCKILCLLRAMSYPYVRYISLV
jgi:hypothetical protein